MWQFLLLLSDHMDASPALSPAVGEPLLFACHTDAQALIIWEAKAGADAKAFKAKWSEASVEKHAAWLARKGVRDAETHVVAVGPSIARVIKPTSSAPARYGLGARLCAPSSRTPPRSGSGRRPRESVLLTRQKARRAARRSAERTWRMLVRRRNARRGTSTTAATTSPTTSCGHQAC